MSEKRLTIENAVIQLNDHAETFKTLFTHGTLEIEIYKPDQIDLQQPHTRDEVYIIASGHGEFVHEDKRQKVVAHEVLFVPAGNTHRFENFTQDFSTWVIFYGPEGGES